MKPSGHLSNGTPYWHAGIAVPSAKPIGECTFPVHEYNIVYGRSSRGKDKTLDGTHGALYLDEDGDFFWAYDHAKDFLYYLSLSPDSSHFQLWFVRVAGCDRYICVAPLTPEQVSAIAREEITVEP